MRKIACLIFLSSLFIGVGAFAQDQDQKTPTPEETAAKEADRLGTLLKLEDWQIFYVDSTLQHDYTAYQEDIKKLQSSKVDNYDIYTMTWDRWMDQIENTYRKIFTEAQWNAYLKAGAGKQRKAREKRRARMAGAKPEKNPSSK